MSGSQTHRGHCRIFRTGPKPPMRLKPSHFEPCIPTVYISRGYRYRALSGTLHGLLGLNFISSEPHNQLQQGAHDMMLPMFCPRKMLELCRLQSSGKGLFPHHLQLMERGYRNEESGSSSSSRRLWILIKW
ncbi:hypothetical protein V6N13_049822 [Hibiscus sabdariffa]